MTNLSVLYFDWLCALIDEIFPTERYRMLLNALYITEFTWVKEIPMDENAYINGVDLRYRFGYDKGFDYNFIEDELGAKPCSVMEMMIALALRCEEDIMSREDAGNRTGLWFWDMIANLGLDVMDDSSFDMREYDFIIERFLTRSYRRNGEGNIVCLKHTNRDLRDINIWNQMMLYLNEKLKENDYE